MFCSNCGKSLRPESDSCQHCGANLGEDRFYGNSYTSSQVRIPAEMLHQTPVSGMIAYTRTNYMSDQPEQDLYSGTTYRPLLSDDEDLQRKEDEAAAAAAAEEEARRAEEQAQQEAEAVQEEAAEEADEFAEEAPAEEAAEEEFENLVVEESEIIEEEPVFDAEENTEPQPEEDHSDLRDPDDLSGLDPLPKAAISPRVLSYMEELDRIEKKRAAGGSGVLRMPSFLQGLRKKSAPVEEELPEAEDIPGVDAQAAEEAEYAEETEYAEEAEYTEEGEYAEEAEYAENGEYAEEAEYTEEGEYAEEAEYAENGEYAEEAEYTEDGEHAEETEYTEDGEYVADDSEDDGFDSYDEEEYSEEDAKPRFSLNINFRTLFENRILKISVAAVLVVALVTAGIFWLSFVTTKRARIADINYDTYAKGIELLTANTSADYRTTMKDMYLANASYADASFIEDMTELNALMPEAPTANEELFVTTLTIIQDAIADAVRADANSALNGTEAQTAADSELRWQAIANAVNKLSRASTPGELSVLVSDLESVVAPTPTPSPTPVVVQYETLSSGMMNDLRVLQLQNRLVNLGYLTGTPDGDFGPGTEKAIKAFQRAAGLMEDGIATPALQEALYADDAPRVNATVDSTAAPSDPSAQ